MTLCAQPPLPHAAVREHAPTMNVQAARSELGCTEKEVRDLCCDQTRGIRWAWDIRSRKSDLREIRILRDALFAYRDAQKFTLDQWKVFALLFPARGDKPFVIAPDFSMALTCTDTHTTQLVREKSLPQMRETKMRAGRNGAAVIAWSVVIAFLRERRLGSE